jgi:Zn-dependent protease with chaperone function
MFANFFYFIIALLIYATYQPTDSPNFSLATSLLLFLIILIGYTAVTWMSFQRLHRKIESEGIARAESRFTALLTRHAVLAILIFAINVYGLSLPSFSAAWGPFGVLPTLQAVLFVAIFIGYLAIVWACAHESYQILYYSRISRKAYVISNISFAMPVLLPWVILSSASDLVQILPFDDLKDFLSTPLGEVLFFLVFLFAVALVGPLLIQKFWQCKPLETGQHRTRIENLCRSVNLGYRNILHWPIFEGRIITAGVMGLVRRFRFILVTRALLELLEPDEIDAVIAHEIGHVKHRHLVYYLIFFIGYMVISYSLLDLVVYALIYLDPVLQVFNRIGFSAMGVTSLIFGLGIIAIFLLYFRFIFGFFMRNFERQADAYVFTMFGQAKFLIRTLEKIAGSGRQSPDKPNWHHFSISQRINFLKNCDADRTLIYKHKIKIRKSLGVYFLSLVMVGTLGYQLNYGVAGQLLSTRVFEKAIQMELEKTPGNADLHTTMGDLYFERKRYAEAVAQYQGAIAISPNHARALNNLAWLYATCEDTTLRDPEQALLLAQRAADIDLQAHVLDTLAESYFVNGDIQTALITAKAALELADRDRSYYRIQIKRFESALNSEME